jgi:phosphate transport system protein
MLTLVPQPLRVVFHERLTDLRHQLAAGAGLAATTLEEATAAVLDGDQARVAEAKRARAELDGLAGRLEEEGLLLLALEGPVASELREVVDAMAIGVAVDRMGGLALHVAEAAERRDGERAVPDLARPTIRSLGEQAVLLARKAGRLVADPDLDLAREVESDDDVLDALHRKLFVQMLDPSWPAGVEGAIDVALLGRYYERFGDQAVNAARRVCHMLTGEYLSGP